MCLQDGILTNRIITESHAQFSLLGMVNPSWQNQGTASVYIDGRLVLPGESFVANLPNLRLKNAIPIVFENDPLKTRILYLGFGQLEQN